MKNKCGTQGGSGVGSSDGLSGVELIAAERKRQIEKEDWTASHDDEHNERELARAASCYLHHYNARSWVFPQFSSGLTNGADAYRNEPAPDDWPWSSDFWNPKNPKRDLIRAAALIAAELDRLLRAEAKPDNDKLSDGSANNR